MKFLLNPLVPGAQSGLVDGYIVPNTTWLKGKLQANASLYEGQYAPPNQPWFPPLWARKSPAERPGFLISLRVALID